MEVDFFDEQKDLPIKRQSVKDLISSALAKLEIAAEEVAVFFVSVEKIVELHKSYFHDGSLTDTISFPLTRGENLAYCHLGDIFVCPKVGLDYASKENIEPYEEVSRYLVHGLLHLLGFRDDVESEKIVMEKNQEELIAYLKEKGKLLRG